VDIRLVADIAPVHPERVTLGLTFSPRWCSLLAEFFVIEFLQTEEEKWGSV